MLKVYGRLKVFEGSDIDRQMFGNDTMKNIKRTVRKFGRPLGHRYGVYSNKILNYNEARLLIYIPSYKYVLDNVPEVHQIIERIKEKAKESDIVLLDYNLNPDNRDSTKPLSHAELVKMYIEGHYPTKEEDFIPYTAEELKALKQKAKKHSSIRKKIETQEDKVHLIQCIIQLLKTTERSAREISNILGVDCDTHTMKKYLDMVPGIKTHKERRTIYYTLQEKDTNPSLF